MPDNIPRDLPVFCGNGKDPPKGPMSCTAPQPKQCLSAVVYDSGPGCGTHGSHDSWSLGQLAPVILRPTSRWNVFDVQSPQYIGRWLHHGGALHYCLSARSLGLFDVIRGYSCEHESVANHRVSVGDNSNGNKIDPSIEDIDTLHRGEPAQVSDDIDSQPLGLMHPLDVDISAVTNGQSHPHQALHLPLQSLAVFFRETLLATANTAVHCRCATQAYYQGTNTERIEFDHLYLCPSSHGNAMCGQGPHVFSNNKPQGERLPGDKISTRGTPKGRRSDVFAVSEHTKDQGIFLSSVFTVSTLFALALEIVKISSQDEERKLHPWVSVNEEGLLYIMTAALVLQFLDIVSFGAMKGTSKWQSTGMYCCLLEDPG